MSRAITPASALTTTKHENECDASAKSRNPLVIVGAAVTAAILISGFIAFKTGDAKASQRAMRARVIAQGVTVGIMLASSTDSFAPAFGAVEKMFRGARGSG